MLFRSPPPTRGELAKDLSVFNDAMTHDLAIVWAAAAARARRSDPATSQRAASKVERFASGHFAAIRKALAVEPGTFKAIASRSGLERHAVARRLPEMERAGIVRRDGEELGCTRWCLA